MSTSFFTGQYTHPVYYRGIDINFILKHLFRKATICYLKFLPGHFQFRINNHETNFGKIF